MTNTTRLHSASRLPSATGIDTTRPIDFTVDGQAYSGFAGDTIASALIAAGRIDCGNSTYLGRARGILGAGVEESNALVRVHSRFPGDVSESMLPATRVTIADGLQADYPDEPSSPEDAWWLPARLGGGAPDHAEVLAAHRERMQRRTRTD